MWKTIKDITFNLAIFSIYSVSLFPAIFKNCMIWIMITDFSFFFVLNFKNKPLLILISGISYRIYKIAFYSDNYYCIAGLIICWTSIRTSVQISVSIKNLYLKKKWWDILFFAHFGNHPYTFFASKKLIPPLWVKNYGGKFSQFSAEL